MHTFNLLTATLLLITPSFAVPFSSAALYRATNGDQVPTLDDATIRWEKYTSTKGVSYDIGRKVAGDAVKGSCDAVVTGKNDFGVIVNWPQTGSDDNWIYTPDEIRKTTAITRYSLHNSHYPGFDFVLEFTNTENYDYYFYDPTGDYYRVNTYSKSDHLVRFNSKNATIVFITGS